MRRYLPMIIVMLAFTGVACPPTPKEVPLKKNSQAKTDGIAVGRFVAEQTLIARATDGANAVVNYTPGTAPGDWRPTPPAFAS